MERNVRITLINQQTIIKNNRKKGHIAPTMGHYPRNG